MYHGTSTDYAQGINSMGLLPGTRQAGTGRSEYANQGIVPSEEQVIDSTIPASAFITPNKENAEMHAFFAQNARNALPEGSGGMAGMVGVRAKGLAEAIQRGEINPLTNQPYQLVPMKDDNRINQGSYAVAGGIPRQFLTPVMPSAMYGHNQNDIEQSMNNPNSFFQQPMPLDWSGYDRNNPNNNQNYPIMASVPKMPFVDSFSLLKSNGDVLVIKDLRRWFKEKWVDVSRKDKDGKHPPCGRSKASKSSKGYPKCRPSVKVSSKTPRTSGSMSEGEKQAATKRKRAKKQGVGGKPTIVKGDLKNYVGVR